MSLLLDALKKAERDKQKAREAEAAAAEVNTGSVELPAAEQPVALQTPPAAQPSAGNEITAEQTTIAAAVHAEQSLNEIELVLEELPSAQQAVDQNLIAEITVEKNQAAIEDSESLPPLELEKNSATTTTVSDEALQLLVYKTNKKYRQKQKLIWGTLLSLTVVILLVAGGYHYYGVLEEVDALERKHRMTMQVVRAEPVTRRQIPTTPEAAQAAVAMQSPANKADVRQATAKQAGAKKPATPTASAAAKNTMAEGGISIQKTNTQDPINTLLNAAWQAYNKADYSAAGSAYEKVLRREPKNRDALLGMAAVAMKNNDYKKARESYRLLLQLDPRDQVAMAAMTNIDELSAGTQDESKLKFMLQQQPNATHLNYALGNYYARKGQWPEAQSAYFKAWQGNAENADYVYNLAVSLDQLGKRNEALRFYRESLTFAAGQNISFSKTEVEKRIKSIAVE